jgi:4-amino-4-deoxy-L-arabinose transferase-like glycosyltransferase
MTQWSGGDDRTESRRDARTTIAWLVAILAVAAFLRLFDLGSNPAGLFRDEAEKGYSAWSLARTGSILELDPRTVPADPLTGLHVPEAHRWPLFINVWGSQTSTIYQVADVPFVALLGPTWLAVRLPAALAGILTVFLTWGLGRELTRDGRVGLWAAALVAVGPWDVVLSRWAHQGIFVPVFMTAGVWAAVRAWRSSNHSAAPRIPETCGTVALGCGPSPTCGTVALGCEPFPNAPTEPEWFHSRGRLCHTSGNALFAIAAAAQALAFYTYSGARPFLLAFWTGVALLFWRGGWARRRALWPAALVFAAFLAPSLWAMLSQSGEGMGRFNRVSIFGAGLSPLGTAALFLQNYAAHFSPTFLFFTGDANLRHGVPGFGVLLALEAIWLPAGLCWMLLHRSGRRSHGNRLLLLWFLLFPVSAALTREGIPHALRTLHAIPAPQIVGAIGAVWCCDWLRRRSGRVLAAAPIALTTLNGAWLAVTLFTTYPQQSSPAFEQGIARAVMRFREVSGADPANSGARLYFVPGAGLLPVFEPFLFHLRTDPAALLGLPLEKYPVQPIAPNQFDEKTLVALPPGDGLLMSGGPIAIPPGDQDPVFREAPRGVRMERFALVPLAPDGSLSQAQDRYVLYWRPRAH